MSLRKIKLSIYILFFLIIQIACSYKTAIDEYSTTYFKNYANEYLTTVDSVKLYTDSLLSDFVGEYIWKWEIDSMVCLNSSKNLLFTTVNISSGSNKEAVSDEIIGLLGKKIKSKWYFFHGGGTLIVPRDMYKKDEMHPLSFKELSVIARKEMFGENALIKKDGEFVVNDKWVEDHFEYNGMCAHCKTHEQYDSTHWKKIIDKWKHKIDTNEFKRQIKNNY